MSGQVVQPTLSSPWRMEIQSYHDRREPQFSHERVREEEEARVSNPRQARASKMPTDSRKQIPPAQQKGLGVYTGVEFQQVNLTHTNGKVDAKILGKVRAHVMRQIHQNRRAKAEKALKGTEQLWSPLGAGRIDPFLNLSTPNVPKRYHELTDFCE